MASKYFTEAHSCGLIDQDYGESRSRISSRTSVSGEESGVTHQKAARIPSNAHRRRPCLQESIVRKEARGRTSLRPTIQTGARRGNPGKESGACQRSGMALQARGLGQSPSEKSTAKESELDTAASCSRECLCTQPPSHEADFHASMGGQVCNSVDLQTSDGTWMRSRSHRSPETSASVWFARSVESAIAHAVRERQKTQQFCHRSVVVTNTGRVRSGE